jgi:ribonucleoside-triphosphate reductase
MRSIEEINNDLMKAREELATVQGDPAEVYSRIVGYYRSVRNWNKGKKEEYRERKLFEVPEDRIASAQAGCARTGTGAAPSAKDSHLMLFVRPACPACPSAKAAAGKLGIPVDTVNADTEDGLAEAGRRHVFSTPTAILLSKDGKEIKRALDSSGIAALEDLIAG